MPTQAQDARVAAPAPATTTDPLYVTVPAFDSSRSKIGPCRWQPIPGLLPAAGARCVLITSDDETPWVVLFDGIDLPIPDLATQAELAAVAAKVDSTRYAKIVRNSNAAAGNDYNLTGLGSTTPQAVDSTNLRITKTCTGRPMRAHLRGMTSNNTAAGSNVMGFRMDGAAIDGGLPFALIAASAGQQFPINLAWDFTPSAGSHFFEPWWNVASTSQTGVLYARAAIPLQFVLEELPYA